MAAEDDQGRDDEDRADGERPDDRESLGSLVLVRRHPRPSLGCDGRNATTRRTRRQGPDVPSRVGATTTRDGRRSGRDGRQQVGHRRELGPVGHVEVVQAAPWSSSVKASTRVGRHDDAVPAVERVRGRVAHADVGVLAGQDRPCPRRAGAGTGRARSRGTTSRRAWAARRSPGCGRELGDDLRSGRARPGRAVPTPAPRSRPAGGRRWRRRPASRARAPPRPAPRWRG